MSNIEQSIMIGELNSFRMGAISCSRCNRIYADAESFNEAHKNGEPTKKGSLEPYFKEDGHEF